jgi:hypothetical protein
LAACALLCRPSDGFSQALQSGDWFTRLGFTPAYVLPTNPFAAADRHADAHVQWTPSMTFEIGRQTDGSREWHHLYGLPSYGFGFSVASFGDSSGAGRPLDAYTFFSWPFARPSERVHVTTDFGMGVSWNWKEFDRDTASYSEVLGSNMNVRIDWGFYLRYLATPQTSLYAGVDFTHRSNGGTQQPDLGINVIGPSVSLRYSLGPERRPVRIRKTETFRPVWEFVIGAAGGPKRVMLSSDPALQHGFGALDATAAVQRHFYRYGKVAAGADLTYDGSTGAILDPLQSDRLQWRPDFSRRLALGFYGGYEHIIGRFGAIVQFGYTVARGFDAVERPRAYQRYGWRYHINDRLFGTFSIRSIEGRKADFLEIGAGYRMLWQ